HHGAAGTAPAGGLPAGATPEGVEDLLGNVFQWTASPFDATRSVLRGCAWDDAPGTCRCAFRHGRPAQSRHVLIGFRCASN
ncbi:MAG: SUMF1/EgtB/PvdO family nonheme iron enzyme, partial [Gammaproteobacteria bacterium]|nr:SUMF1/EgtB/PvdO family nonheme iron enzyme [Gammaproteobacteria bacterium]